MSTVTSPLFRRFEDSIPVFAVLLPWMLLSILGGSNLGAELWHAGLVMALLYVVVRGVSRSHAVADGKQSDPDSIVAVLRDSGLALAVALPWFLLAIALELARTYTGFYWIGSFVSVAETTGLLTVVLYAVMVGTARLRAAWG
jgi:hypothetical protein